MAMRKGFSITSSRESAIVLNGTKTIILIPDTILCWRGSSSIIAPVQTFSPTSTPIRPVKEVRPQEGHVSQGQGSQESRPQGPQTFTDKDGNEVTKTPDGYTSVKNADGTTTTLTPGGYEIKYDSANSTATITDSKSGESSTIWGDPHVSESDGGSWEWQSETSSYVLSDGTKITMNSNRWGFIKRLRYP